MLRTDRIERSINMSHHTVQEIVIPGELPTLNAVLAATKSHWSMYAATKKQMTNKVAYLARKDLRPIENSVEVEIEWTTKDRRQDPDNISYGAKYLLDGLVAAGILQDDNRKIVCSIAHRFPEPSKKHPQVRMVLTEVPKCGMNGQPNGKKTKPS